ncbi:hypothetical protein [Pararhizobium sp. DWP1-1-3]|uniref:hypothetical protein n=1 Tax=Pararhizobium sp. DWP1-1-3 TaxID=2804652 RepID=UPI003CF56E0F
MNIEAPKLCENHPDRDLQCQECVEVVMQEIIAEATRKGWESVETIQAMQEILMRLRLAFAGGLYPEDPLNVAPQPYYDGQIDRPTFLNRSSIVRVSSPQPCLEAYTTSPQT